MHLIIRHILTQRNMWKTRWTEKHNTITNVLHIWLLQHMHAKINPKNITTISFGVGSSREMKGSKYKIQNKNKLQMVPSH